MEGTGIMRKNTTYSEKFDVTLSEELQMRPAAMLVETASRFNSEITVSCKSNIANAKSVISLLLLEATLGTKLTVITTGSDAQEAMAAIANLFMAGC